MVVPRHLYGWKDVRRLVKFPFRFLKRLMDWQVASAWNIVYHVTNRVLWISIWPFSSTGWSCLPTFYYKTSITTIRRNMIWMAMAVPDKTSPTAARTLFDLVLTARRPTISPQIDTGRKIKSKLRTPAISATVSGSCRLLVFRAGGVGNAGYAGVEDLEGE